MTPKMPNGLRCMTTGSKSTVDKPVAEVKRMWKAVDSWRLMGYTLSRCCPCPSNSIYSVSMSEDREGEVMSVNEKGLSQLSSPVKIFIVSYAVLIAAGLLLSLWIVLRSPMLRGSEFTDEIQMLEESGMSKEQVEATKAGYFYESMLKRAHVHHLGHIFMVFSVAGIYVFTREKSSIKIQIIVWTTIATLIHTLAFLIYSRALLIVFGSVYGILLTYMLIVTVIDCYRPVRE